MSTKLAEVPSVTNSQTIQLTQFCGPEVKRGVRTLLQVSIGSNYAIVGEKGAKQLSRALNEFLEYLNE